MDSLSLSIVFNSIFVAQIYFSYIELHIQYHLVCGQKISFVIFSHLLCSTRLLI